MRFFNDPAIQYAMKCALSFFTFTLIGMGLMTLIYESTLPNIQQFQKNKKKNILLEVMQNHNSQTIKVSPFLWTSPEADLGHKSSFFIHKIYDIQDEEKVVTVVIPVETIGYGGSILFLIGIHDNLTISRIRIISHRETPGIGDYIDQKNDFIDKKWVDQFEKTSIPNTLFALKKNHGSFDGISGASLSPQAIIKGAEKALIFAKKHYEDIFKLEHTYEYL